MTEQDFVSHINEIGGRAYLVGGAVRDKIRGVDAKDKDYCVTGVVEDDFNAVFPDAKKVGNSFPVFILKIDDQFVEVAFARTEKKSGVGYHGFNVSFQPNVTIEEDLNRRDTTMNAMAIDLSNDQLIDPFGGAADIAAKLIRATSKHFVDDPVRALRAARQAAQFQFDITDDTILAMNACGRELSMEPSERIVAELNRALQTDRPSIFFRSLERARLLEIIFPELHQLIGQTQPSDYHPEGDSFEHAMKIVDDVAAVNDDVITRFCALAHDLGKGTTPKEMLPHHYRHDQRGLVVLKEWNARSTLPRDWLKAARFVIDQHMRAAVLEQPGKIVDMLMMLHRSTLTVKDFCDIIRADNRGQLPPYLEHATELIDLLLSIHGNDHPPDIAGEQIGDWLRRERIKLYLSFKK